MSQISRLLLKYLGYGMLFSILITGISYGFSSRNEPLCDDFMKKTDMKFISSCKAFWFGEGVQIQVTMPGADCGFNANEDIRKSCEKGSMRKLEFYRINDIWSNKVE